MNGLSFLWNPKPHTVRSAPLYGVRGGRGLGLARSLALLCALITSACWWGRIPEGGVPPSVHATAGTATPKPTASRDTSEPSNPCDPTVPQSSGTTIPLCTTAPDAPDAGTGADGYSTLSISDDDVGDACESFGNGGQRIRSGLDNGDGDGVARNDKLEAGEVDHTTIICNGADGERGDAGPDGSSCSAVRDDEAGYTTITCEDGTEAIVYDGEAGAPGERGPRGDAGPQGNPGQDGNSCTAFRDEQAGRTIVSCEDGTTAVVYDGEAGAPGERGPRGDAGPRGDPGAPGLDGSSCTTSRDEDAGVTTIECEDGATAVVYDGLEGERGARGDAGPQGPRGFALRFLIIPFSSGSGTTCPDGGVWIQSGLDTNENGVLDGEEKTEDIFICNGSEGADGQPGADGVNSLIRLDTLSAGEVCPAGGVQIFSGLDENGNQSLDDDEIEGEAVLCQGDVGDGGVLFDPIVSRDIILYDADDVAALAGVTEVVGNVTVRGSLLINLEGLSSLERIHGNFVIEDNAQLTTLSGLSSLRQVDGHVSVRGHNVLQSVSGLSALETVGGDLRIENTTALTTLSGLDALQSVAGTLALESLTGLTGLAELANLTMVGGDISLRQIPLLGGLAGLENLQEVAGDLRFVELALLSSLSSLERLSNLGGILYIRDCPLLARVTIDAWSESVMPGLVVDAFGLGDAYEPEDFSTAPDLLGAYTPRTLTVGDEDWFRFAISSRSRFSVRAVASEADEDAGATLWLQVHDDQQQALRTLAPFSPPDRLGPIPFDSGVVLEPGNYWLRVSADPQSHPDGVNTPYVLYPKLVAAGAGAVRIGLHAPPLAIAGQSYPPVPAGVPLAAEQYLVRWRTSSMATRLRALRQHGLVELETIGPLQRLSSPRHAKSPTRVYTGTLQSKSTLEKLRKMREDSVFDLVEPNYFRQATAVVPNDARYPEQWHYPAIALPDAWEVTTGSDAVRVAVLDTGIVSHPDFNCGRLLPGFDFVDLDSVPVDLSVTSGRVSHGTHVMGTIGACSNVTGQTGPQTGVAGVDWNARLLPVRVLDANGSGNDASILAALLWSVGLYSNANVATNPYPAHIVNLSLGGAASSTSFQPILDAVYQTGAIVVVAAGNDAKDALLYTPANATGVIAVAAHGPNGRLSSYSNYGSAVAIMAPGGEILSATGVYTEADGVLSTNVAYDGTPTFAFSQGTSMAAPHVAGVVALMKAVFPALDRQTAIRILQDTASSVASGDCPKACGAGRLNAFAAVTAAKRFGDGIDNRGPVIVANAHELKMDGATSATLRLRNIGDADGTVQLFADNGAGTAQVSLVGLATLSASSFADYTLELDYGDLLDGRYSKWIAVSDTSGAMLDRVRVVFERSDTGTGIPGTSTRVSLLRQTAPQSYRWERVLDSGVDETPFTYMESPESARFEALPTGDYLMLAEADVDGDGEIDAASLGEDMSTIRKFEIDGFGVTRVDGVQTEDVEIRLVMLRPFPDFALEMLEPHDVIEP